MIEVLQAGNYYFFVKEDKVIKWNRKSSAISFGYAYDLCSIIDIESIGETLGIVGLTSWKEDSALHLVVVKEAEEMAVPYPPYVVYRIKSICVLGPNGPDSELPICKEMHDSQIPRIDTSKATPPVIIETKRSMVPINKIWTTMKRTLGMMPRRRRPISITQTLHEIFEKKYSFYISFDVDKTTSQSHEVGSDDVVVQPDKKFFINMCMEEKLPHWANDKTWVRPFIATYRELQCRKSIY